MREPQRVDMKNGVVPGSKLHVKNCTSSKKHSFAAPSTVTVS